MSQPPKKQRDPAAENALVLRARQAMFAIFSEPRPHAVLSDTERFRGEVMAGLGAPPEQRAEGDRNLDSLHQRASAPALVPPLGDPVHLAWLSEASRRRGSRADAPAEQPIITALSNNRVKRGATLTIYGLDLGEHVWMEHAPEQWLALSVAKRYVSTPADGSPVTVGVDVLIPHDVKTTPGFNAMLRMQRADGLISNDFPVRLESERVYYYTYFDTELQSTFGIPGVADGIVANGHSMTDPGARVEGYTVLVKGPGHAELVEPMASGKSLAQGYHIGNAWFEHTSVRIFMQVSGVAGEYGPENIAGLPQWTASDLPWVPSF
jgi:hypothetical protein